MEGPGRLVAGIGITVALAALSVYLLTQPSGMAPANPGLAADPPLIRLLLQALGLQGGVPDGRHLLAALAGALNVGLIYGLFRRIRVARTTTLWLTVAFGFGTVHWWVAAFGDAAALAHVLAVTFTILALLVALSGGWPVVCGLLLGFAAAARLPVALTVPLFLALYLARPANPVPGGQPPEGVPKDQPGGHLFTVAALGGGLLVPLLLLGQLPMGPFDLDSVPRHLHAAYLRSFDLAPEAPWLRPNLTATSLLLTSPFYLWLFRARSRAPIVRWGWAAVALVALPTLLGPSGAPQFGYRPSLDVAPVLFLLLGWVFRDGLTRGARLAVVLAVLVNTYGMIVIALFEPPFATL